MLAVDEHCLYLGLKSCIVAVGSGSNWNMDTIYSMEIAATTLAHLSVNSLSAYAPPVTLERSHGALLPVEIIQQIIAYFPRRSSSQRTLWACCLVSRAWYSATVSLLYARPYLQGRNFQEFAATVCPSKNAHIRLSQLAGFVRVLDMGELVHDGSKSLTARLLGRLKGNLTEFIAPQASFSINSFAALSKCTHLTFLNLSLMSASVPRKLLFQTLQSLTELRTLYFPRTNVRNEVGAERYDWPPKLEALHFSGGIDDVFLRMNLRNVPQNLHRLSIQSCPLLSARRLHQSALGETLVTIGPQLRYLTLSHPLVNIDWGALDQILIWCPKLIALRLSADFVSDSFYSAVQHGIQHPLRILDIDVSDSPNDPHVVFLSLDYLCDAVKLGALPDLRSVRINKRLGWPSRKQYLGEGAGNEWCLPDLVDLLEEHDKKDPLEIMTGVWTY